MKFPKKDIIVASITGAAGQIGYSLLPMIARGNMLGYNQKVELRLLDLPQCKNALEGVRMELMDCAFPLLRNVVITDDPKIAFDGCDIAVMCGAFPRKPGMERKDLLLTNAEIFRAQGRVLGEVAHRHCRVVVVGNPANTNALILASAAKPNIDPKNVTALTRLDHNRATALSAAKAKVPISSVKNCIIWGNHSNTQVPDVNAAVGGGGGVPIREIAKDDAFFDGEFIKTVQERGLEIIKTRGQGSAASAATAIVDHVRDWIIGMPTTDVDGSPTSFVSMAVISDGNPYGVPPNLCFSFPVTCKEGEWKIVEGVNITEKVGSLIQKTTDELVDERCQAGLQ